MTTATRTRFFDFVLSRPSVSGRWRVGLLGILASAGLLVALAGSAWASPPGADPTAHYNWTDLGYKDKDVVGQPLEEGGEPMSPPFILMLVNFGIVLIILGKVAAPRLGSYVRTRHQTIKEALEESALLREQARAKLDEYTERVKAAEQEVDKMIADIRADAEAEKARILADADAQAAALKRDAESRIAAEIDRARLELEREVVAVAVAAAEKIIREKATGEDQSKLVTTFIEDVRAQAGTSARERV